jgi:hypothetical protein
MPLFERARITVLCPLSAGDRRVGLAVSFSASGTKRTRSPISPRPDVEDRPEVVGAVQNDEIDLTWKSRIHRYGHKSRDSLIVDDQD